MHWFFYKPALDHCNCAVFRLFPAKTVIEKKWSYVEYNGQRLGKKTKTRGGILSSGEKSFWIKLPTSSRSKFWFELGLEDDGGKGLLKESIRDSSFKPAHVLVSVVATRVEEERVTIHSKLFPLKSRMETLRVFSSWVVLQFGDVELSWTISPFVRSTSGMSCLLYQIQYFLCCSHFVWLLS